MSGNELNSKFDFLSAIPVDEYLENARLKEIVTARLFIELDKHADERKRIAIRFDNKELSARPDQHRQGHKPTRNTGKIWLLGPELSGMIDEAVALSRELLSLGYEVHLASRIPLDDRDDLLSTAGFHFHLVRPLEAYGKYITKQSHIIAFYLPLSAGLLLSNLRHVCIIKSLSQLHLPTKPTVHGWNADLWNALCYLPSFIFAVHRAPEGIPAPRKVHPFDIENLIFALGTKAPVLPPPPRIPTVSACMIARDEEGMIEDCLLSLVPVADQVVVNDTGSTDRTPVIAQCFGAECFRTQWEYDFSQSRNASLERAVHEYVLSIDADERVSKESRATFKLELTRNLEAYEVELREVSDTASFNYGYLVRVFKNRPSYRYSGRVHEQIATSIRGPVGRANITLDHVGYNMVVNELKTKRKRNIDLLIRESDGSNLSREYLLFQSGVEMVLSQNYLDGLKCLLEAYRNTPTSAPFRPLTALRIFEAYLALEDFESAHEFGKKAIQEYPGFLEMAERLAQALVDKGEYQEAHNIISTVTQTQSDKSLPQAEGAETYRLELLLAEIAIGLNEKDRALEHACRAIRWLPEFDPAQRFMVMHWPEKACSYLAEVKPKSVRPAVMQCLIQGLPEMAEAIAKSTGDTGSLGEVFLHRKDYHRAAEFLLDSSDSWDRQRGEILAFLGFAQGSAAGRKPEDPVVARVMKGHPCKLGEVATVLRLLDFLLEIRAMDTFFSSVESIRHFERAEFLIGRVVFNKGLYHLAYKFLTASPSKDLQTMTLLADTCYKLGYWNEAASCFETIRESRWLTPLEYVKFISVCIKKGQLQKAKEIVREARHLYPDSSPIREISTLIKPDSVNL